MKFNPGIDITPTANPLGFRYDKDCFGPEVELRSLDSIRPSLLNPSCEGPDPVYSIAMDVGRIEHKTTLAERNLLFGVVTYAAGRLGKEPVRSQGHLHKKTRGNTMSPPEIYEIWSGKAIIYMQESADDNPGKCYAVEAGPGEVVIVPPDWAHATISVNADENMTFGAWCDRDYGFDYDLVRKHKGLAWFPTIDKTGKIRWVSNKNYRKSSLMLKRPESYENLGIVKGESIYQTFAKNPDTFLYVSNPARKKEVWRNFVP